MRLPVAYLLAVLAAAVLPRLGTERLPDLNVPRGGGLPVLCWDELTVFGGHTDGFVRLGSAEYFKDGRWNSVPSVYPHDNGFIVRMPDGKVLLGGGSSDNFGIGQDWGVEEYDPAAHSFRALGILDRKRSGCSALAFDDGKVVVSGNWYAPDGIEMYEPGKGFSFVKEVARERYMPYILRSGPDEVLVFSGMDNYGTRIDGTVDRLRGEPFHVALLDEWEVLPFLDESSGDACRIADYTYLLLARRDADGQVAPVRLAGEEFGLLDMEKPLPCTSPEGDTLRWSAGIRVDRPSRKAFATAFDGGGRLYVVQIDYDFTLDGGKARYELWRTGADGVYPLVDHWLLFDGGIVTVGGTGYADDADIPASNNFETSREVHLFRTGPTPGKRSAALPWIVAIILIAGLIAGALAAWHRGRYVPGPVQEPSASEDPDLMERIARLMEVEQLFRKKDLKVADVAEALGTNTTYVYAFIKTRTGQTFTEYINRCRVRYAQQQLKKNPTDRITDIGDDAGFSSEASFFRNFKAYTGITPMEWRKKRSV